MHRMLLMGKVAAVTGVIGSACWVGVSLSREFAERQESLVRVAIRLPRAREAAKRAGLYPPAVAPVPASDLKDDDNSALLYEVMDAEIRAKNEGDLPGARELVAYLDPARRNDRNRDAALSLTEEYVDTLETAADAAMKPRCVFTFTPDADAAADDNLLWTQWLLIRLTLARAVLASEEERPLEALRLIDRALRVSRHATERGDFDGLLVRASSLNASFLVLTDVLRSNHERADKMAVGVTALLAEAAVLPEEMRAAVGPTVRDTLAGLEQWRQRPYSVDEADVILDYNRIWRTLYDMDRRLARQEWTDGMEALALDYLTRVAASLDTKGREGGDAAAWVALRDTDDAFRKQYEHVPPRALPFAYTRLPHIALLAESRRALARATFRLLLAKKNTGTLPDTIPGLPIRDPFSQDGSPLRFERDPRGRPALYSVGENQTDEGGSARRTVGPRGPAEDTVLRFDEFVDPVSD